MRVVKVDSWDEEDGFVCKPKFWAHVREAFLYPFRMYKFWRFNRNIEQLFTRQIEIASAPLQISSRGKADILNTERETRQEYYDSDPTKN